MRSCTARSIGPGLLRVRTRRRYWLARRCEVDGAGNPTALRELVQESVQESVVESVQEGVDEGGGVEGNDVFQLFSHSGVADGKTQFMRDRDDDAALGGAV
jgi:hypothetical protein